MILVGLTGGIGHGKSTLAKALAATVEPSLHLETSDVVAEVANMLHAANIDKPRPILIKEMNEWLAPLPSIIQKVLHRRVAFSRLKIVREDILAQPELYDTLLEYLKVYFFDHDLGRRKITPENKYDYRLILQWLGGYLVAKVDAGIWYDELIRRAQAAARQGTRLCVIGGVRYPSDAKIVRKAGGVILEIRRPEIPQRDLTTPTERHRSAIRPDSVIENNADLAALKSTAHQVLIDLQAGNLQKTYTTTSKNL